ncbi:MAG TPA: cytidylate kinase family protein [Candidatus Saccharimonadales bacterium]|nr:cytidylate kinase family protein [Candidatus Saccharimonadales bacterium]
MSEISNIRIITVSGRIGAGSTTLAKGIAHHLGWKHIEGGEVFWEAVRKKMGLSVKDTNLRPDNEDELFDAHLKSLLESEKDLVLETKLAGFIAAGIEGVFKIGVVCEDRDGNDQTQVRIDRLVNREDISVDLAKTEVLEREQNDLSKWRKLYANNDPTWTYFDKKYYDTVINTFMVNKEEAYQTALSAIEKSK